MAQQTINVGAAPNDGTGTPLRTAFQYCNSNFSELYTATGPSGNNIVCPGTLTVSAGTVALPSLTTAGDTNTGIYFPAADTIGFTEGGFEAMRINSAGNLVVNNAATITGDLTVDSSTLKVDSANNRVGIGTTSPAQTLDVAGTVRANASFNTTDGTNTGVFGTNVLASGVIGITSGTNVPLLFGTNATERARIDTSGNLGLGVTPSAWSSFNAFQSSYGSFSGNSSEIDVSHNAYYNAGWKYIANGYATNHYQTNGTYVWRTAPSGTAGNAITFTQAMTLDASGRLLVGVTTAVADHSILTNGVFGLQGTSGGTRTSYISNVNACSIYYTDGGATYPFDNFGNLIIQPRTNAGRSVIIATSSAAGTPVERLIVDPNGNTIFVPSATPPTLAANGQLTVNATSNTNLRFSYRGSDGVTRTANITLA